MKQGNRQIISSKTKKMPGWVPWAITLAIHGILFLFLFLEPFSRLDEDSVSYLTLNTDLMQFKEMGGGEPAARVINAEQDKIKSVNATTASTADAGININDSTTTKLNTEGIATPDSVSSNGFGGDTLNYMDFYSGTGTGGNGGSGVLAGNMKLPTFMGGDFNVFRTWFLKRFHVPLDAPLNYKERVIVSFSVDKNGRMQNIKVRSCSSPEVGNEIIRVLKNAPKWEPGFYNGEPSGFNLQMPVSFK
jgi:hypothetical protein